MVPAIVTAAALALPPAEALVAAAVEKNEALYHDLDVTYRSVYRRPEADAVLAARRPANPAPADGEVSLVMESVTTVRFVRQRGMYRVTTAGRSDTGIGEPDRYSHAVAHDGTTTRVRRTDGTEAVGPLRPAPKEAYFPHLWASGSHAERFPLSISLAGGAAWERSPGRRGMFEGYTRAGWVMDAATLAGEPCVVVRCDLTGRRGVVTTDVFWLAARKNFLPLRTERFLHGFSSTLPLEVVTCGDFREVRPGLWLPLEVSKTVYERLELPQNRLVVSHTETATVLGAVLNPRHPPAFFRDLTPEE
ncbi:MAG: hypothetical protein K2X87_00510 [Gemmataceae bacterium]|nr:hypothetical protein [Gemmataceae bacterium]